MWNKLVIFFAFLILAFWGNSQEASSPSGNEGQGSLKVTRNGLPEKLLSSNENPLVIRSITLENNLVTKNSIIYRELLFAEGDTISSSTLVALAEESRQNLLNTSLFNFVEIVIDVDEQPYADVIVSFVERWYLWPFPIIELGQRNLNTWLENPRISRLNYGVYVNRFNFRGRNETIALLLRFGYKQNFSLTYTKPYFNRAQTLGFGIDAGVNLRREVAYLSVNNKQVFYSQPSGLVHKNYYFGANLIYRPAIHNTHILRAGFSLHHFADSLLLLNPDFLAGDQTRLPYLHASYLFKNDHRDIKAYPLKGHYFDIEIRRNGLGLLKNENLDITEIETSLRKFWKIYPRIYGAAGINAKVSTGRSMSYFYQQGLGFEDNLVRGFEDYVVDGQHFFIVKSNLKYNLVPQRSTKISFIENPTFSLIHYAVFLNIYADAGFVNDVLSAETNPLGNKWLGGTGIGLDFVTYYDRVFRIEYSLNSLGGSGFYFHMIAPI